VHFVGLFLFSIMKMHGPKNKIVPKLFQNSSTVTKAVLLSSETAIYPPIVQSRRLLHSTRTRPMSQCRMHPSPSQRRSCQRCWHVLTAPIPQEMHGPRTNTQSLRDPRPWSQHPIKRAFSSDFGLSVYIACCWWVCSAFCDQAYTYVHRTYCTRLPRTAVTLAVWRKASQTSDVPGH